MNKQRAKLIESATNNGWNYGRDKELVASLDVMVNTRKGIRNPVTLRCYMGRSASATVVYASVWIHGKDVSLSGKGSASGGGYCKQSAAAHKAIRDAGVELSMSVDSCGMSCVETALEAIAKALGYRGQCVIVRN